MYLLKIYINQYYLTQIIAVINIYYDANQTSDREIELIVRLS